MPLGNKDTEIQVSTDGVRYTTVLSYTAPNDFQYLSFGATDARFVKVLMKSGYSTSTLQIKEVSFYGSYSVGRAINSWIY